MKKTPLNDIYPQSHDNTSLPVSRALIEARVIDVRNKITTIRELLRFPAGSGKEVTDAHRELLMNQLNQAEREFNTYCLISAEKITAQEMENVGASIQIVEKIEKQLPPLSRASSSPTRPNPTEVNPGKLPQGMFGMSTPLTPHPHQGDRKETTITGISYRQGEGNILSYWVELDFDDLKLRRDKSNQLRTFVKEQIQNFEGYIEHSYQVNEQGIVSVAFSREKAARNFQALLQDEVRRLKESPSPTALPQG